MAHTTQVKKDGTTPANQAGRPPQITQGQKQAIANKAMGLKRELLAPTPERMRICMPRKTINKETKKPISDSSIQRETRGAEESMRNIPPESTKTQASRSQTARSSRLPERAKTSER